MGDSQQNDAIELIESTCKTKSDPLGSVSTLRNDAGLASQVVVFDDDEEALQFGKEIQPASSFVDTRHLHYKSSVRNLSRRTLANIPAAKPDSFWFKRDEPFHARYTLPADGHHNATSRQLRQTAVSIILSVACYLCLILTLPTLALVLWNVFRERTGGVFPLPSENSTNSSFVNDLTNGLP